jgi:GNAT superfamily N-acetyltransferase
MPYQLLGQSLPDGRPVHKMQPRILQSGNVPYAFSEQDKSGPQPIFRSAKNHKQREKKSKDVNMPAAIQKATLNDLSDIQNLNNGLFELELANSDPDLIPDWPLSLAGEAYFKDMIENHFVLVARDGGQTIGYFAGTIGIKEIYSHGNLAEIDNMFVLGPHRGRGVGRMLFDAFRAECIAQGITDIRVTASAKNIGAVRSYEKWGFAPKNVTLNYKI